VTDHDHPTVRMHKLW